MFVLVKQQIKCVYNYFIRRKFSAMEEASDSVLDNCKKMLPPLVETNHKGMCGRIGIFGGSVEFTGAPYYSAICALRSGADLTYVFTVSSAATVLKTFSPELMVFPYLDADRAVQLIMPSLAKLHTILIGPGLGRSKEIFVTINEVINVLKSMPDDRGFYKPLVFDADGLFFLSQNPKILKDYPGDIYVTPNIMEFKHLISNVLGIKEDKPPEVNIEDLCKEIGHNVTVVLKGKTDLICNVDKILQCKTEGSNRRCGGQGDMLSGTLATFAAWVAMRRGVNAPHISEKYTDNILAGYSACCLTRVCNRTAYREKSRTMLTTDMINAFPKVFLSLFCDSPSKLSDSYEQNVKKSFYRSTSDKL